MTDAIIDQKAITAALFEQWDVIYALASGLDEAQWRLPTPLPGWDVHAVVAHVIGTEAMLLGDPPPAAEPQAAEVSAADHVRNPIGSFNELWVVGLRPRTGAELLSTYRDIVDRRHAALEAMTAEQWNEIVPTTPVGPASYGRFMQIRLFDCWVHELDIRDALATPGDEGGVRGELSFAEITPNLGFTIGKRGKAPAGATVALNLTGPLAREIFVEVTDRARLVDALDGPPTVRITLDSGLFTRLFGGRTTAAAHAADITIDGDKQLGRQLLDNFATTI